MLHRPADVDIEIANKTRDMAGSISELQERARINEVYDKVPQTK